MFNVLNHINILMQDNVPLASSLLEKYSDILRYQLYNGQKELISLEQEIEFLQNYIAIENIRWEDKLAVSTEWEVEDGSIGFPPLLLLTFIENAFKHASHTPTEKGQVQIRFKQNAHHILLEVGNTSSRICNDQAPDWDWPMQSNDWTSCFTRSTSCPSTKQIPIIKPHLALKYKR